MTARTSGPAPLLAFSLFLNFILAAGCLWPAFIPTGFTLLNFHKLVWSHHERGPHAEPSQPAAGWSRHAAEAAEAAAAFNCSGNGDLYTDTVDEDMLLSAASPGDDVGIRCECYECFVGPRCATLIPDCDADVESGDPLLFAPFWKQNAKESAILIPGWYRMGYSLLESSDGLPLTPALENEIRTLHNLVGNAVVDDKYIMLGLGTTLLLNAAVSSLSPTSGNPANVVSAIPYYQAYRTQTQYFENSRYVWAGDAISYAAQESTWNESSIEFVNSPNNPDTMLRVAVLNGSLTSTIYDLVYYWPHFTAITASLDYDVMLFSLSKITGHAGSRLGWAIIKNYSVYTRMLKHLQYSVLTMTHESQLRATQLLRSINKAYSNQLHLRQKLPMGLAPSYYAAKGLSFHFGYAVLHHRWTRLTSTLDASQQLGLQEVNSTYCNFFKEVIDPSPAYAWVHCKQKNEEECQSLLTKAGILARNGSNYGASNLYARFSLLKRDSTFENLIQHLSSLVSKERFGMPSDPNLC